MGLLHDQSLEALAGDVVPFVEVVCDKVQAASRDLGVELGMDVTLEPDDKMVDAVPAV